MTQSGKEGVILEKVLTYLSSRHIYRIRMTTTGIPRVIKGKMVLTPNPASIGMADILAIVPLETGCRVIWIETKREKGGIQSTHQKVFEHKVKKAGCEYYLIRSIEELEEILG